MHLYIYLYYSVLFLAPDLFSGDVNNFSDFKCDYVSVNVAFLLRLQTCVKDEEKVHAQDQ